MAFHLTSIEVLYDKLLLFGNDLQSKPVSYEIKGFEGYFFVKIPVDNSIQDIIEATGISKYEICQKKRLIGFTFECDKLLKIYYSNLGEKSKIEKILLEGITVDNQLCYLELCHNDWTMDKLFLFEENIELQSWISVQQQKTKLTYTKNLFKKHPELQGHSSSICAITLRKNEAIGALFYIQNDVKNQTEEKIFSGKNYLSEFNNFLKIKNPDCILYCSDNINAPQFLSEKINLDRYDVKNKFGRFSVKGRILYDILDDIKKMTGIKLDGFTMKDICQNEDLCKFLLDDYKIFTTKEQLSKECDKKILEILSVDSLSFSNEKDLLTELRFLRNFEKNRNGLTQFMEISQLCHCDLNACISGGQQVRIWSFLQKTVFDRNYYVNKKKLESPCVLVNHEYNSFPEPSIAENILPMHVRGDNITIECEKKKKKEFKKYQGGYVREPIAQLYNKDYTATFDFSSLYPSIIIGYKLCYSTLLYDYDLLENKELKFLYVPINDTQCVVFVQEQGIVPEFLQKCLDRRKYIKGLMKKLNPNEAEYALRDAQQLAAKVTCNATYGFLDVRKNAVLSLPALRISVCSVGQWMNKFTGEYFKENYQMGIVYGDTDSVMCQTRLQICSASDISDEKDKFKKYWEFYENCAKEVSKFFPAPNALNMESIKCPFLMNPDKKTYAAITYMDALMKQKKLDIKGFSFSKRDRCIWVRNTGAQVIDLILNNKLEDIEHVLKKALDDFIQKRISREDLVISCSVSDNYKNEDSKLIQKEVRKKIESTFGKKLTNGSRLSFVVVAGKEPHYMRGDLPSTRKKLDYTYYLEKQFYPPMKCILTCISKEKVDLDKLIDPYLKQAHRMNNNLVDITSFFKRQKV